MVQLIVLESRRWFSDQPVSINKCMDDAIVLLLYSFSMTSKLEEIVTRSCFPHSVVPEVPFFRSTTEMVRASYLMLSNHLGRVRTAGLLIFVQN